jgi:elongation factor 2
MATEQRLQKIQALMRNPDHIRNFSVIAHVDHGKTTLVDSLLAKGGLLRQEDIGVARSLDTKTLEKEKGITISSTGVSIVFEHPSGSYLVNLVDSPGHVDFNGEVSAALRVTDGALVVVDSIEGVSVQTETVVRQALAEHIKPVLHINKLDRGILEMSWNAEEMYKNLERVIEDVNVVLATYQDEILGDVSVDPIAGSVSFGSGKQGWAFTLPMFARIYAQRTGLPAEKILKKLWGDHYHDPETNTFLTSPISASGKTLPRFFCKVVMDPLIRVFNTFGPNVSMDTPRDANMDKILKAIGVTVSPSKWESFKSPMERIKYIMLTWLPAGDALTELIVEHLPSPRKAQQYRFESLYNGPVDSEIAQAIKNCDPEGPFVFFVSKMIPTRDEKRMLCFGRVFSGTMRAGQKVRILAPGFDPSNTRHAPGDLVVDKPLQRINVQIRFDSMESIDSAPCGNLVAVMGLDSYILKTATVTDSAQAHTIKSVKFSVSPVVAVAVETKSPSHLPKLIDALRHLAKVNQMLRITTSDKGENIVAGVGELHLEVALDELQELVGRDIPLVTSRPVVDFCETITAPSSITTLAKSQNKHNRVSITAQPIPSGMAQFIQQCSTDPKERIRQTVEEYPEDMDTHTAARIWGYAPETEWQNLVTQSTTGVQLIQTIKDSVVAGFQAACAQGALCGEPLRDARFNLVDATLHQDSKHSGFGQVMPAVRRAIQAAQLASRPRIMEPVYKVEIQAPMDCSGAIHSVLSKRRGVFVTSEQKPGSPLAQTIAHLPVAESFGFALALREATGGRAFPSMAVDHWQVIDDDPFEEGSLSNRIVKMVRARKGLPPEIPTLEQLNERL